MRFYNQQHRFYGGVDLHAKTFAVDFPTNDPIASCKIQEREM